MSGAWPIPASYVHFLMPVEARLPVADGQSFDFFGPTDPPFDDIVDVPHELLADQPGVLCNILFGHISASIERLLFDSITLAAVVDTAYERWSHSDSLRAALRESLEEVDGLEMTVAEVSIANSYVGIVDEAGQNLRVPPEECLEHAVHYLNRYIRSLASSVDHFLAPLLTLERLPSLLPYFERATDSEPDAPGLLLINDLPGRYSPAELADEAANRRVEELIDLEHFGHPFALSSRMLVDSRVARHIEGNYKASVVFAAASAEILLDGLLESLLWEERVDPRAAAELFADSGLAGRVRRHYHSRLAGNWSTSTHDGAMGQWQHRVAAVRHRVVHAGYEPSEADADTAIDAVRLLRQFLGDRVADRPRGNLDRYPLSALHLLGSQHLRSVGKWAAQLEAVHAELEDRQLLRRFGHWKFFVDAFLREEDMESDPDDWGNCRSVLAIQDDGSSQWWLNDEDRRVAKRGGPPPDLSVEARGALESLCQRARQDGWSGTTAWLGERGEPESGDPWRPNYQVLPDMEPW